MTGFRLAAVIVGFPLTAWLIGEFALARVAWLDRAERFVAAWGVGFAVMATSQFAAFALGVEPAAFNGLVALAVLFGWAFVAYGAERRRRPQIGPRRPWADLLGFAAQLCAIQWLLPAYLGGGWAFDWWMHYGESLVFLGSKPIDTVWVGHYTIASRTPLYNLTLAWAMSFVGRDYWVFQLASVLTNSVAILPIALVAADLFGERGSRLAVALAALNVWLLHEAWFTWSKMLLCYYLLLGVHFHLRWLAGGPGARGAFVACWLAMLAAFLTHQVAAVYGLPLAAQAAWVALRNPARRPRWMDLLGLAAAGVSTAGPWYAWLAAHFGSGRLLSATPTAGMLAPDAAPRGALLAYARNALSSIVPDRLIGSIAVGPVSAGAVVIHLTALYFCQLPGALTLSASAYLIWGAARGRLASPGPGGRTAVGLFTLLGGLGAALLVPAETPYGILHNALAPSTVAILVVAWGSLAVDDSRPARWATVGAGFEFLAVFWAHVAWVYYYLRTGRIADDLNWVVQRQDGLVFLHDLAPRLAPIAAAACLAMQGYWVVRLRRSREAASETP
jgi:hypothetical protein